MSQMAYFGIMIVNDTPGVLRGCQQYIKRADGHCIPICIRNGLPVWICPKKYVEIVKYRTDFYEIIRGTMNTGLLASTFNSSLHFVRRTVQKFMLLKPKFGVALAIRTKKTLENTMYLARLDTRLPPYDNYDYRHILFRKFCY